MQPLNDRSRLMSVYREYFWSMRQFAHGLLISEDNCLDFMEWLLENASKLELKVK